MVYDPEKVEKETDTNRRGQVHGSQYSISSLFCGDHGPLNREKNIDKQHTAGQIIIDYIKVYLYFILKLFLIKILI